MQMVTWQRCSVRVATRRRGHSPVGVVTQRRRRSSVRVATRRRRSSVRVATRRKGCWSLGVATRRKGCWSVGVATWQQGVASQRTMALGCGGGGTTLRRMSSMDGCDMEKEDSGLIGTSSTRGCDTEARGIGPRSQTRRRVTAVNAVTRRRNVAAKDLLRML